MTCRYNTFNKKLFFLKLVALFDSQTLYAKSGGRFSCVENSKWKFKLSGFVQNVVLRRKGVR